MMHVRDGPCVPSWHELEIVSQTATAARVSKSIIADDAPEQESASHIKMALSL